MFFKVALGSFSTIPKCYFPFHTVQNQNKISKKKTKTKITWIWTQSPERQKPNCLLLQMQVRGVTFCHARSLDVALSVYQKKKDQTEGECWWAVTHQRSWILATKPMHHSAKARRGCRIKVLLQLNHSGCLSQTLIITFLPSFFLPCVKHRAAFDWAV